MPRKRKRQPNKVKVMSHQKNSLCAGLCFDGYYLLKNISKHCVLRYKKGRLCALLSRLFRVIARKTIMFNPLSVGTYENYNNDYALRSQG